MSAMSTFPIILWQKFCLGPFLPPAPHLLIFLLPVWSQETLPLMGVREDTLLSCVREGGSKEKACPVGKRDQSSDRSGDKVQMEPLTHCVTLG